MANEAKLSDTQEAREPKSAAEYFFDARAPFHWNKMDVLRIMEAYKEAALSRSAEPPKGWREGFVNCHVPVPKEAIEENRKREPIGERIRKELTEFLERNGVVGILLDTETHNVNIQIAKLPPEIKPVLTHWGSIYIRNEEKFMELESRSPFKGDFIGTVVGPSALTWAAENGYETVTYYREKSALAGPSSSAPEGTTEKV